MSLRRLASGLAVWAVASAPAWSQVLAEGQAAPLPWWRWFAALSLCLLLAVVGAFVLRARLQGVRPPALRLPMLHSLVVGGVPKPRRILVLEARRISPTLEVCLLSCDGVEHLVVATPQAIVRLPPPSEGEL